MNLQSIFNQMLQTGASTLGQAKTSAGPDFDKYAKGAAVGGLLGLLLGTQRGRSVGGKALKYGSVAAIGALAWKAYQDHQAAQAASADQASQAAASPAPAAGAPAASATGRPARFEALPATAVENSSRAMLSAMISAARADGHLDEREQQLVQTELTRMGADDELRRWVDAQMRGPVDPAAVAAQVASPEQAAEVYLASLIVADETTAMERLYLDELARALKLDPALKSDLEQRVAAA